MHPTISTFGESLRRHRLRAGKTQRELAGLAGLSVRTLRDIECGRVRPRPGSMRALASVLGLDEFDGPPARPSAPAAARSGPTPAVRGRGLALDVLGPTTAYRDGARIAIGSPLVRDLLGLLALHQSATVAVETIIDVLWGDAPPRSCRNLVHVYIGQLRTLLEPGRAPGTPGTVIERCATGYRIRLDADQLDLTRFTDLVRGAETSRTAGDRAAAHDLLHQALESWRGPIVAGAGARLRQHPVAVKITNQRRMAALVFADLTEVRDDPEPVVTMLSDLIADDPLHEGLHARLVIALARSGESAAALQLYFEVRGRLADELGIGPGEELQAAHLAVLRRREPIAGRVSHGWC